MFGTKAIAVWVAIAAIVGTGSLAIATGLEQPVDIQHVSDAKIHLQDVDGKINTNVPVAASRAFSPLPVTWTQDEVAVAFYPGVESGTATLGSTIVTKQKIAVNFINNVSTFSQLRLKVDNNSEDKQIFLIKAAAPPQVILDFESSDVTVHGIVGNNEWLASVPAGNGNNLLMEVSVTDAGFYPIALELLRVG